MCLLAVSQTGPALVAYLGPMHSTCRPVSPAAGFRPDLLRWRQLVPAQWLRALLAQQPVVAAPAPGWHLLEVACEGEASFARGHIPGARYVDTQWFERPPYWNQIADADLHKLLRRLGLGPRTTVILYGRNTLAAARVALCLLYAGVQDVRLLDGGLNAWCAAGGALEPGPTNALQDSRPDRRPDGAAPMAANIATQSSEPAGYVMRPDYVLNLEQTRACLQQPDVSLVSIRSHAEWMGQTSGYSYIAARGEIAGALWGHAGLDGDVNSMSSFQEADGCMKSAAEIAQAWAEQGILPQRHAVFYCGTGWRASLAFFYAWLMGWERISVFDGGWMEWSADPGNAVVCRSA